MIILVCGGRTFNDYWKMDAILRKHVRPDVDIIIHGGASGADSLAGEWAADLNMPFAVIPADWSTKAGGIIRNKWMLRLKPDKVIAFPGGRGTAHMVKIAREANIEVIEIQDDGSTKEV